MRKALFAHVLFLLLAATSFTVVTGVSTGSPVQWCSHHFSASSEITSEYVSEFSRIHVLTYLAAFFFGLIGFGAALFRGRTFTGTAGVLLSIIGLVSFGQEASNWFTDQPHSWIAICPPAMFGLAALAFFTFDPKKKSKTSESEDEAVAATATENKTPQQANSAPPRRRGLARIGFPRRVRTPKKDRLNIT